ncbi:hypothetical protein PILCRDRAFT_817267 [Piloderma croceum F 1598]|uniref:N-alpha-acetyltransferase 40 n=1 Tax=Piloderma croceum (strain F 1598) TaxID=765440 RepID=A0A0C3C6I9_PILCF|nr:hypothetical protein PILCRDRAFT_817267 [Piloderma croceum F 1598]
MFDFFVESVSQASAAQLALSIPLSDLRDGSDYGYTVATSSDLNNEERDVIWDIFQTNMHQFYINSVFGWDPVSKQRELFDPLSRFVLVHQQSQNLGDGNSSKWLVAYTMFRFDMEEGEEVVYCYELQVSKAAQQRGLGKILMQSLVDIGHKWGMRKVMLTVLKRNTAAIKFYQSAGFTMDPISPEYQSDDDDEWVDEDDEGYDYEILSKSIAPSSMSL